MGFMQDVDYLGGKNWVFIRNETFRIRCRVSNYFTSSFGTMIERATQGSPAVLELPLLLKLDPSQ